MKKILFFSFLILSTVFAFTQTWTGVVGAPLEIYQGVRYTGDVADSIGASQNNYNIDDNYNVFISRIKASSAVNITGLANGSDGREVRFFNRGTFAITFKYESASSTAANRFVTSSGGDAILRPGATFILQYDATAARWRIINQDNEPARYKVLITQASTSAPAAATTLENTIGNTLTWARTTTGTYTFTITGYTAGRVFVNAGQMISSTTPVVVNYTSALSGADWVITIKTFQNGTLTDGLFTAIPFEVEIYP
ncbi:MAG: hypothetical protein ACKVPJ_13540 [Chitinophagales bacterium]